jgi:hypothetical protein
LLDQHGGNGGVVSALLGTHATCGGVGHDIELKALVGHADENVLSAGDIGKVGVVRVKDSRGVEVRNDPPFPHKVGDVCT